MKHLTFLSVIFLFAVSANAQSQKIKSDEFVLNGKIIGEMSGYLRLKYVDANGNYIHDSCLIKNNTFQFKGRIHEPTHAYLDYKRRDEANATEIFLEPQTLSTNNKCRFPYAGLRLKRRFGVGILKLSLR